MSIIKKNIMESAARSFSEKGYADTSIQEIADDCGIAKGSVYKYFQSKEDLYIAFHQAKQAAFFSEMEGIRFNPKLTLREALILETEKHFEFFWDNKHIMHDFKELNAAKRDFTAYFLQLRANLLSFSKEGLIRLLGEAVRPNIWDLVITYNGILREFMFLMVIENKSLNPKEIAVYIIDRMEEIAASIVQKKTPPILPDGLVQDCMQCASTEKSMSTAEYRTSLIEDLLSTVKELPATNFRKTELNEMIAMLQEELANENHKPVLVRALLNLLGNEHELKNTIRQLERLIFAKHKK